MPKQRKGHLGPSVPHYPAGTIPGQPAAGHHPFKSKAQQRLFFANPKLRRWAIGKAHATGEHHEITQAMGFSPAYRSLPDRKGSTFHRVPTRPSGGKHRKH